MKRAPGVVRIAIAMRSNSIGHRIHFWRAHKREEWKIAVMIPQSSYKEAMDHLSNNLKKNKQKKMKILCTAHCDRVQRAQQRLSFIYFLPFFLLILETALVLFRVVCGCCCCCQE